jgi:hypothetical protein
MVGLRISGFEVVAAAAVTVAGLGLWVVRLGGERRLLRWSLLVLAVATAVMPNLVIVGRVFDLTWDGQWFHQEAVIQLAEGWNPYQSDLGEAAVPEEGARIRINGYPKASWLWGASLYRLTGRIERAKAFSFVLMVAAALTVLAVVLLETPLGLGIAGFLALVAAANPLALTQLLNAYHDGAMASLLSICASALVLWGRTGSRSGLFLAATAAVGAASIKPTGLVYVAIFVASAALWRWWCDREGARWLGFGVAFAVAAVAVVLLSGGAYLTNIARHGHPMYPLLGPEKVPIVEVSSHRRLEALAASLLSRSRVARDDHEALELLRDPSTWKLPFTFDRIELESFFDPRVRVGGWGPLFSGEVFLAVVVLVVAAVRRPRWALVVVVGAAPLVLSVLVNPYCWKARYVPQSALIPLVIAILALLRSSSRWERVLVGALLVTAGLNSALVGYAHLPRVVGRSAEIKHRLLDLGRRHRDLHVDFQFFRSNRVRLAELGIGFTEVDDPRHHLPVFLGMASSAATRLEVRTLPSGGRTAGVEWTPTPGALEYRVEALMPAPTGPGGSVLSVVERRTTGTNARMPLPAAAVDVVLTVCNALGCGVPYPLGRVARGGIDRSSPVMGTPDDGAVFNSRSVLFSWLPVERSEGGYPPSYRFRLDDLVTGQTVLDQHLEGLWIGHRFSSDGEWRARVELAGAPDGGSSSIRFRTDGISAPRMTAPASELEMEEGWVEIEWEHLAGVSSYEVFVAVEGRPNPVHRAVTTSHSARVELRAENGETTRYSAIVRACHDEAGCTPGQARGWGPWTTDAGLGDVKIIVRPGRSGGVG